MKMCQPVKTKIKRRTGFIKDSDVQRGFYATRSQSDSALNNDKPESIEDVTMSSDMDQASSRSGSEYEIFKKLLRDEYRDPSDFHEEALWEMSQAERTESMERYFYLDIEFPVRLQQVFRTSTALEDLITDCCRINTRRRPKMQDIQRHANDFTQKVPPTNVLDIIFPRSAPSGE